MPQTVSKAPIGIISAIRPELAEILSEMSNRREMRIAGRKFRVGRWRDHEVIVVLSRMGKVSAALTTAILAERFGVHCVVFSGTAGALTPLARVGDVVVVRSAVQYDMDASPIFTRFEVPMYGKAEFASDEMLSNVIAASARQKLADPVALLGEEAAVAFHIQKPQVFEGLALSGDRFFIDAKSCRLMQEQFPQGLCVDMESAAIAQACHDFGIAFSAIRTIGAQVGEPMGDSVNADFGRFIESVTCRYNTAILSSVLQQFQ